ncbi:transient receptor potential cation channel subfamily M member-like 2 [Tubulanus polymorphus]|uniref:transient receptor potential cation channel subfamily M member-like 2 n=1 Tax=Tubulanus polymorphus TaxID=672921 RepID=UPI003DA65E3C
MNEAEVEHEGELTNGVTNLAATFGEDVINNSNDTQNTILTTDEPSSTVTTVEENPTETAPPDRNIIVTPLLNDVPDLTENLQDQGDRVRVNAAMMDVPDRPDSSASVEHAISINDSVAINNTTNVEKGHDNEIISTDKPKTKLKFTSNNEVHAMGPETKRRTKARTSRPISAKSRARKKSHARRRTSITALKHDVIAASFSRKECVHFVQNENAYGNYPRCFCGGSLEEHYSTGDYPNRLKIAKSSNEVWDAAKDIKTLPTNTYGKINFTNIGLEGRANARFVRLSNETDMDDVLRKLLLNVWGMNSARKANLVISITGGGRNFEMDPRVSGKFETGLVKAARSTNAWIMTAGFHMGIVKAVGRAISKGQTFDWGPNRGTMSLQCIGICPWGYVDDRYKLTPDGSDEIPLSEWDHEQPVDYYVNNVVSGKDIALDPNHTHFIMVDDGTRGEYMHLSEFRAALERKISLPDKPIGDVSETGLGTPIVMVIVEGGPDALIDCATSMRNGVPVVVCSNSGRAADILAEAYDKFKTLDQLDGPQRESALERIETDMCNKMKVAFSSKRTWRTGDVDSKAKKYFGYLKQCCKERHMITIFDLKNDEDFDKAILKALLTGTEMGHEQQEFRLLHQLQLALLWDRSDVAQEQIFSISFEWSEGNLDAMMTRALIENKLDFVELLMMNGLSLKDYLTVERLTHLYNSFPKQSHEYFILRKHVIFGELDKSQITLLDVSKLLRRFIGKHNDATYLNSERTDLVPPDTTFSKPYRELLFWSLLQNRSEMALMFWENGEDNIKMAIAAALVCTELAKTTRTYKTDLKNEFLSIKSKFEERAYTILGECEKTDPILTSRMLLQTQITWGGVDYLELAAEANSNQILSSTACQRTVNNIWRGRISSPTKWTFFSIFIPPFIFCLIKFKDSIHPLRKIFEFYRTPLVKFVIWLVVYSGFLCLYTYTLLFRLKQHYFTVEEILTMTWLSTMLFDEFREVFVSGNGSGTTKLKKWWSGTSNKLDFVIYVVAIISFGLRASSSDTVYQWARHFYAINCVFLYCRILSFYSANSKLGPRLVVIKRVLSELVVFMAIMLVFMLAYGVTVQSLLYPTMTPHIGIMKEIVAVPYWQIYGEIFLEELSVEGQNCTPSGFVHGTTKFCRADSWLAYVLLALYLLIGNVLLLNLLIAIYNNVFQEVEDNALDVWKFDRYGLVKEYQEKPALPPPLVIFEDIVIFILSIIEKCKKRKKRKKHILDDDEIDAELELFENIMSSKYSASIKRKNAETVDERVKTMKKQMDDLNKKMDLNTDMMHESASFQQMRANTNAAPDDMASSIRNLGQHNNEVLDKLQKQNTELQKLLERTLGELSKTK